MQTWPLHTATVWQKYPFLRLLPALVAGIVAYDQLTLRYPFAYLLTAAMLAGACFVVFSFLFSEKETVRVLRHGSLQLFLFLLGLTLCTHRDDSSRSTWYGHRLTATEAFVATVTEEPVQKPRSWKTTLQITQAADSTGFQEASGTAMLYLYRQGDTVAPFHEGDVIVLPNVLTRLSNAGNPFDFDAVNFYRRNNLFHSQIIGREEVLVYRKAERRELPLLTRGHNWSVAQLKRYLPTKESFGLMQAMLMGDERDFDPELRQTYSETGVVHIVSISGSHTATLFLIVAFAFRWLRKTKWKWFPFVLGTLLVWLYVLMAGAPPSALRSAIMFTVFAAASLFGREQTPINTLLSAAFLLLCFNPMWLFAVGFQLSFLAVFSLIIFYQPFYRLLPLRNRLLRQLWMLFSASIAAEILTAPLVMYYFHNFPLLFFVANVLAFVLVGLVAMVSGLAILVFSGVPTVAGFIGFCLSKLIAGFNNALLWLNDTFSPTALKYLQINAVEMVLLYCLIGGIAVAWLRQKKQGAFAGLAAAVVLLCLLCISEYQRLRQDRFLVYNLNRHFLAETQAGKAFTVVAADTVLDDERAVRSARTGFQAWKSSADSCSSYIDFHGKKILALAAPVGNSDSALQADVLIIGFPVKKADVEALQQTFRPQKTVVAGYQKRWVKLELEDSIYRRSRNLHLVWSDGAFVMD